MGTSRHDQHSYNSITLDIYRASGCPSLLRLRRRIPAEGNARISHLESDLMGTLRTTVLKKQILQTHALNHNLLRIRNL